MIINNFQESKTVKLNVSKTVKNNYSCEKNVKLKLMSTKTSEFWGYLKPTLKLLFLNHFH